MGKYLEDQGMPLAYHHHMGTVIETQEDTERLLDNTDDSVKLTLILVIFCLQREIQKILKIIVEELNMCIAKILENMYLKNL